MSVWGAIQEVMGEVAWGALHLLYPPRCPLCERPLDGERVKKRFICEGCLAGIGKLKPPWCLRCGEPFERSGERDLCERCAHESLPYERARAFGLYEGDLARLIRLFKFGGERALAGELAHLLAQALEEIDVEVEGITFVPMHLQDQRARGFNQSELLAKQLGRLIEIPVFPTLRKPRRTRPQVELALKERLENLRGAFAPLGPARCERLLLIDDVYTTGATTVECSRVLQEAGYEEIYVLTVARTPPLGPSDPSSSAGGAHAG